MTRSRERRIREATTPLEKATVASRSASDKYYVLIEGATQVMFVGRQAEIDREPPDLVAYATPASLALRDAWLNADGHAKAGLLPDTPVTIGNGAAKVQYSTHT